MISNFSNSKYKGKRVLVYGKGITGSFARSLLKKAGAKVFFFHDGEKQKFKTDKLDFAVISPGISRETALCQKLDEANVPIISELELGFQNVKGNLISITGTNGKTTTCLLLSKILRGAFYVGNTDRPLSSLYNLSNENDFIVCETSSFQLETTVNFCPKISAILNLAPDHLSRHKTFENYVEQKKKIFKNQTAKDFTVLNYDDALVSSFFSQTKAMVFFFSRENHEHNEKYNGVFVSNSEIYFKNNNQKIYIAKTTSTKLMGQKNLENVLASCLIAFLCGKTPSEIEQAILSFQPPEHRLEMFFEKEKIKYINDSKATNVASVLADVNSLSGKIVLLCGGSDKGEKFEPLFENLSENVERVVVFGKTRNNLAGGATNVGFTRIVVAFNLEDAILKGKAICEGLNENSTLILSPACASYDEFRNFEERGKFFKNFILGGEKDEK